MTLSIVTTAPVAIASGTGPVGPGGSAAALSRAVVDAADLFPAGVVVDLSGVQDPGTGPVTLDALPELLAAFPARPVALVAPAWVRLPRGVNRFPDRESACLFVAGAAEPPRIAWPFSRISEAAADARRAVTDACVQWRLEDLAAPAQLVVTELVTNAVLHAGTDLALAVTQTGDGIHIAVRDGSPRVPVVDEGEPSLAPDVGRGMSLVEAFSTAWGVTPLRDGKIVWSELREL